MNTYRFWRLDSYDGTPADDAPHVGAIIRTASGISPYAWADGGQLGTHFNHETGNWVSAKWVRCEDPTDGAA